MSNTSQFVFIGQKWLSTWLYLQGPVIISCVTTVLARVESNWILDFHNSILKWSQLDMCNPIGSTCKSLYVKRVHFMQWLAHIAIKITNHYIKWTRFSYKDLHMVTIGSWMHNYNHFRAIGYTRIVSSQWLAYDVLPIGLLRSLSRDWTVHAHIKSVIDV